jgi:hypothetical protein
MDAPKGIGLNSRFGTPSAPLGSTVQTSAVGSTTNKGGLGALDWKLKVAIALLILAFVATAASRLLKNKKGKAGKAAAAPHEEKEKEGGKEKESK